MSCICPARQGISLTGTQGIALALTGKVLLPHTHVPPRPCPDTSCPPHSLSVDDVAYALRNASAVERLAEQRRLPGDVRQSLAAVARQLYMPGARERVHGVFRALDPRHTG